MACLERPLTFAQIEASSGWIVHGQPGNYWNEHVNAALALWCTKEAFGKIQAFAEEKRADPGVYDLFSYNCLTFVIEALARGGVSLEVESGKRLRTFIPRNAFRRVSQVTGAHKLGAWKYWFPLAPVSYTHLDVYKRQELCADIALAHRVTVLQWNERDRVRVVLRGNGERFINDANLRAISVRYHNIDAFFYHECDLMRRCFNLLRELFRVGAERIPA